MAQFTFRISAKALDGFTLQDEQIEKTQELFVKNIITDFEIDKTQELFVADVAPLDEEIEKTNELFVADVAPLDEEIEKTQELFLRGFEQFGPEQVRALIKIVESIDGVEDQSRLITFIKDPRQDLLEEIKVAAKSLTEDQVEDFNIIFDNIFNQKVDAESEEKNQFDSFCTVLWVGSFDSLTRFGMAFDQQDTDGNSFGTFKPVDLSLPKTTSINPTLQWFRPADPDESNSVAHDLTYQLELADNFRMRRPIYTANVDPAAPGDEIIQHQIPIDLEIGKTYYWRLRAIDKDSELAVDPFTATFAKNIYSTGIDTSDWTNIFSFEVVSSILQQIPDVGNVTWEHEFLLPPGQEFYFWDVRNFASVDSNKKPIRYRPVIFKYRFGNGITQPPTEVETKAGIPFFINHFAANPPIFLSSQYDAQTHNVVFRILISDSLARRYQLSDFGYLDRKSGSQSFVPIPDAQILGKKKDLQSDILNTTNMGLFTWDRAGDPDSFIDQELTYNPRVLREPLHRNNNFYYLVEELTIDQLYNIMTTNFLDFGAFWGTFFNEDNLPRLAGDKQFEHQDIVDIRFANHNWERIQVEVSFPGSGVIHTFDTGLPLDPSSGDFLASVNSSAPLVVNDCPDFSSIRSASVDEQTDTDKIFDITDGVTELINDSPFADERFHIYVEVNWGNSSHSWGSLQLSSSYSDAFVDSNISRYNSINDSGTKSLLLNSHRDHTRFYFTNIENIGNNKAIIPFSGIRYDSQFQARIVLPNWIPDDIEYRVRLVHIEDTSEIQGTCLLPIDPALFDSLLPLLGFPEIGIVFNPPYGINDFDVLKFEYRIRGIPIGDTVFGPWSNIRTGIKFADSETLAFDDADADAGNFCTLEVPLSFVSGNDDSSVAVQIIIHEFGNPGNVYDSFLSVDDNGSDIIFENNNKFRNWRSYTQLYDWDYNSSIRMKLRKNYFAIHSISDFAYTINIIESDSTVTNIISNQQLNDLIYDRVIQPSNENITSAIVKDFEIQNTDNEPLIQWYQTRTKFIGKVSIDLVDTYFIQEFDFDFISFPDESLRIEYHDPDDDRVKLIALTSRAGLNDRVVGVDQNITADRIDITVNSERPVTMKLPQIRGYRLAPENIDTSKLVFVDTEVTDIVMQDWSVGRELDEGVIIDPNVAFALPPGSPTLGKYTTYRERLDPIRVSLYRDNQANKLLHTKNGREFDLIFTNLELFEKDVTNIVLDFKGIEETFYELRYSDVELLEAKISTADFFVAVRAFDEIELSPWSEFAKTRPANIHTLLWNVAGSSLDATEKMLFICRATISSASTEMSIPVMGFIDFAGTNLQKITAELDATDLIKQQLQKIKTEFQEMIDNRIDPDNPNLDFNW